MSKTMARMKMNAKKIANVVHSRKLRVTIPAGLASSAPPLGSQLGQRNLNIANFCKDFNQKTADIKEGIPIPCRVKAYPDKTYDLVTHKPPATYYLKQAAGIQKGKVQKNDAAGKITLKHLYEIAKIKSEDPPMALYTLQQICNMLVGTARTCGIEIVREIDPVEYEAFLKKRTEFLTKYREELRLSRESRMLRSN